MKNKKLSKLLVGAAVAGLMVGATTLTSCSGNGKTAGTERNGCNGPNGCGGANGCNGPNGCNGHAKKEEKTQDKK